MLVVLSLSESGVLEVPIRLMVFSIRSISGVLELLQCHDQVEVQMGVEEPCQVRESTAH